MTEVDAHVQWFANSDSIVNEILPALVRKATLYKILLKI